MSRTQRVIQFHELSQSSEIDPLKESFKHHELNESSTTTKSKSHLHIPNSMGRTHVTTNHELKESSKYHELNESSTTTKSKSHLHIPNSIGHIHVATC